MNREFAQLVSIHRVGRTSRWHGPGISLCLASADTDSTPREQAVNWDKLLGLATVLVVVALGWTAVGFAVFQFLR